MQAIHRDRRSLGVVYTPPEVTGPMTRVALEPLLHGRPIDDVLALRICDPAIGEGAFLLAAVGVIAEHLVAAGLAPGDASAAAARCVHGVDVDPRAVEAARAALGLGDDQLQVGDALALDWPAAFPAVFARGGFDAVIGNPPYVRQEHLAAHKPLLRGFASYDGSADLYVYFVELAHRLARPGGRFCLITPNKWLTAGYARALRGHLAAQHCVEGVVDLGRTALFGDADAFPCIVWGTAGAPRDAPIQAARLERGASVELRGVGAPHPRDRWRTDPWHIDAPGDRALLDQLERRWPPLGAVVPGRPARGVVTGCNRAFVLDRATRDRLLDAEPAAAAVIRPFIKGRDLRRWLPADPERWILLVDRGTQLAELPAVLDHLARFRAALEPRPADWQGAWRGRKGGAYTWYELQDPVGPLVRARAPRLLYQDIQTGPVCALDQGGDLVPDTTVWMLPSADLFLLAVLGSPLYAWYARRRFPPALNGSVRPKLEYLRTFPVACPGPAPRAAIEGLVTQRLALEPARRDGALDACAVAHELDDALATAVLDAYGLTAAERALIGQG
ncbi:MAG TPA: Eco57I restriction-modification methylase domain-containing protein [Kofleriaceae bacterium]|nr:Eco57I restriction-modification methylase domain-containing protein [Kofleriaceae bacterium]